jgi:hypothetical protein
MAANPVIGLRSNRAHTQTAVLGQLKKSQQNRAIQPSAVVRSQGFFVFVLMGPRNLPSQLNGRVALLPSDPINLSISTERAQGHFLSPWSKSGVFYTKEPRYYLCVYQYGSRKPTAGFSKKSLTFS